MIKSNWDFKPTPAPVVAAFVLLIQLCCVFVVTSELLKRYSIFVTTLGASVVIMLTAWLGFILLKYYRDFRVKNNMIVLRNFYLKKQEYPLDAFVRLERFLDGFIVRFRDGRSYYFYCIYLYVYQAANLARAAKSIDEYHDMLTEEFRSYLFEVCE